MNYCMHCGKAYEGDPGFCPECGSINQSASDNKTEVFYAQNPYQQVPPQQPPYQQPPYQQAPPYQQPPYQQAPPNQQPPYQQAPPYQPPMEVDAPNTGFAILSFFFPTIGLILYLVWKDKTPLKAKSCGKGALISVIVSAVVGVVFGVIYGVLIAFVGMGSMYL